MAGIIGAMLAGGGEGAGKGLESQGKAWTEKQHQDALNEAQAIRSQSLAELQGRIQGGLQTNQQTFQAGQNTEQRTSTEGIHAADRATRATEGASDRASREREGAANRGVSEKQLTQQGRQIDAAVQQINVAVREGTVKAEQAERVNQLHKDYLAATDPAQKDALADQIYTLLGKDKFTPLMGRDDMGQPVYMGGFNTRTAERKGGPRQPARTGWDSGSGDVMVNGNVIGKAKNEAEARQMVSKARNQQ